MKKITILSHKTRIADFTVFPVRKNRKRLRERGYNISIFHSAEDKNLDSDIICLGSRYIRTWWKTPEKVFAFVDRLRKYCNKLIYLDETDSTGTTSFELLPYVDRYLKKQLLKDRCLYTKRFYGDRIFTDYYNREFGECDAVTDHESKPLDMTMLHKVDLSWHIGLGDMAGDILPSWIKKIKRCLPPAYPGAFAEPGRKRPIDFMFRGSRTSYKNTAGFHRKKMFEILESMKGLNSALHGRVSIKRYKHEMRNSKLVVSPFGWGEIGVRDFEAWIYGAALVKPDMSHMETWPDIFIPRKTYYPLAWDFSNLESAIEELTADNEKRTAIAVQGQGLYKRMVSKEGMEAFCNWFVEKIEK